LPTTSAKRLNGKREKAKDALMWHLDWSEKEDVLWGMYEKTGEMPPALVNRPDIDGWTSWYLDAFFLLSNSRQTGMSVGKIPLSEMTNYAMVFDTLGEDVKDFCLILSRLDSAYLEWLDKKKPKKGAAK